MGLTIKSDVLEKLQWFTDSPSPGEPGCLCSLCGNAIVAGDLPVRAWDKKSRELRLHIACAEQTIVEFAPAANPAAQDPAFAEGHAAFTEQKRRGDNPYPSGKKRAAWWAGWDAAWHQERSSRA